MANSDPLDLTGRVALVTGASSHGIGNESAKALAAHGAKVFLTARREDKLREAVAEIEAAGGVAACKACDVSSEDECKAAVDACIAEFGRLDIMVLAAGVSGASPSGGPEAWFDTENWKSVRHVNLDGVFYMVKHGWEHCAQGGVGSIVLIGSLASWHAAGSPAYAATKGAIRALAQWFGRFLGERGVRVNAMYPGFIDTDMTHRATQHDPFVDAQMAKVAIKRFGLPEDCANAVLYLASDASSWMTGQHLVVDGGELA